MDAENQRPEPVVDDALVDQAGGKSSKRIWAYKWGWMAMIQIMSFMAFSGFLVVTNRGDLPPFIADIFKYTIGICIAANLIALGLTLPEWFSPKANRSNDQGR